MALLPIIVAPDPRLKINTEPVVVVDDELRGFLEDMQETMYAADGIGLAAPQIGISQRIIVVDVRSEKEAEARLALVNPEVVWTSAETEKKSEGCLSIPGLEEVITRPSAVQVRAVGIDGTPMNLKAEGLLARVIQHEIDHLEGILFVDRVSALKRRILMKKWKKIQEDEG